MNRPANPYRKEFMRLESDGDAAAGRGEYSESQRLWHQAALLRARGRREVEAAMKRTGKEPETPPPDTDALPVIVARRDDYRYASYIFIGLLVSIIVGVMAFVIWAQIGAATTCESTGGVWISRPGECVEPRYQP